MTITREQVADLQPGDVVAILYPDVWDGVEVSGPLRQDSHSLRCGPVVVRYGDTGEPALPRATLTVVSRAPRPLYVNHPRTESVAGDIVRNDEDPADRRTWMFRAHTDAPEWTTHVGRDGPCDVIETHQRRPSLPRRLRLLVDGQTGQAVQ